MALNYVDFENGDSLLSIRTALNSFNNSVVVDVNKNINDIVLVDNKTIANTTNIDTNTTNITTLDTRITTNETDIAVLQAAAGGDLDVLSFVPQVVSPSYKEGNLFLKDGDLNLQTGIGNTTLQIGKEQYVEVVNNTGGTILNGKVVRQNGVANGKLSIELAQADTFAGAKAIGMTTHDMLDGEEGIVTTFGSVGDMNTNGLVAGDTLFLSATEAGGLTPVAPVFTTKVGGVLTADLVDGIFFVRIEQNVATPKLFASLTAARKVNDGGGAVSLPTNLSANVYYTLEDYASVTDIGLNTTPPLGTINVPYTGSYRIISNIVANFDTIGNAKEDFWLQIHATDGSQNIEIKDFMGKDTEAKGMYPALIAPLVGGKDYQVQIKSSVALNNFSFSLSSFDIETVRID